MTEADLTGQMVELMGMFFTGVSVFATLISAYIVALYAFLRRADLALRAVTFGFLTFTPVLIAFPLAMMSSTFSIREVRNVGRDDKREAGSLRDL